MATLKLIKNETGRKNGKFNYKVIDENGTVISERNSNRDYIACTKKGHYYFGRLDLIGKGDHGVCLKSWALNRPNDLHLIQDIAYL